MLRIALSILIIALAACAAFVAFHQRPQTLQAETCAPSDDIGGPFTLTDENGNGVTEQNYRGRYMLVLFGFTSCPDICPTQLAAASAALDKLGDKADQIAPLFISVDTQHDTPAVLKDYLKSFPRFSGLTGTKEQIDSVVKSYKAFYEIVPNKDMPGGYTVDHTVRLYLMNADGKFLKMIDRTTPDEMAASIASCLN